MKYREGGYLYRLSSELPAALLFSSNVSLITQTACIAYYRSTLWSQNVCVCVCVLLIHSLYCFWHLGNLLLCVAEHSGLELHAK